MKYVHTLIFTDVPGRVAKQLLALSERFGSPEPEGTRVHHDLTQEELAEPDSWDTDDDEELSLAGTAAAARAACLGFGFRLCARRDVMTRGR